MSMTSDRFSMVAPTVPSVIFGCIAWEIDIPSEWKFKTQASSFEPSQPSPRRRGSWKSRLVSSQLAREKHFDCDQVAAMFLAPRSDLREGENPLRDLIGRRQLGLVMKCR